MHKFEMPPQIVEAVTAKQGRPHVCETFVGRKTALVAVDMQNFFMAEGFLHAAPGAPDIVPNVNRLADAVRQAGGIVIWIQNIAPEASRVDWSVMAERYEPVKQDIRWRDMQPGSDGFEFFPGVDIRTEDKKVLKRRYSAFIPGSSDIELILRDHGIDTLLVTGVATNVCCESTARDAMMLNYRSLMVADGCAAVNDDQHAASLETFYIYFGDVQTTDQIVARLEVSAKRNADSAE